MRVPLQLTFRNMPASEGIEAAVRRRAEKLTAFDDMITSCRVVVEAPHKHHRQGTLYGLHIVIGVPGREIVVTREPHEAQAHEDAYVAVRDAFDAARRQLEDHLHVVRGQVKAHEPGS